MIKKAHSVFFDHYTILIHSDYMLLLPSQAVLSTGGDKWKGDQSAQMVVMEGI